LHSGNKDDVLAWWGINMRNIMTIFFCGEGCCDIFLQVKIVLRNIKVVFIFKNSVLTLKDVTELWKIWYDL